VSAGDPVGAEPGWVRKFMSIRNVLVQKQFCVCGLHGRQFAERHMNGLIYLIGLIVVILAILSFFGLR
jgi:hypothetical protein